ncbi:alpha (1,6) fucosyltransferase [Trichuris trichiura]|uniref:Alpha (1,6) fucosyltransferase n=1 Tax=Trichuris trichiura TaxID=36087 RepID=A0A077YY47_TRITR|nr:alpha (1,6) fucosyltransferase [Trichuris trichiura]
MLRLTKLTIFVVSLCVLCFFVAVVLVSKLSFPADPARLRERNNSWMILARLLETQKQLEYFSQKTHQLQDQVKQIEIRIYGKWCVWKTFLGSINGYLGISVTLYSKLFDSQVCYLRSLVALSLRKLHQLSKVVQNQLYDLQHPLSCEKARRLICSLDKPCGFACQVHHVTYCLQVAYYTNRTMVLNDNSWSYSSHGWTSVFQPVSNSCRYNYDEETPRVGKCNCRILTLRGKLVCFSLLLSSKRFRLLRLHSYPPAWWTGELVSYLMRYNSEMSDKLEQMATLYNFSYPIVGIHVRRTDKVGTEARFHGLEEYMVEVEKCPGQKRKVYIATDDPSVFSEARRTYPNYTFIGSSDVARTADLKWRYSDTSLQGIVTDIHFLSLSNFLVCTFSSQVCRLAYEKMQHLYGDAGYNFRSLDDIYYYGGQREHTWLAVMDHVPRKSDEIELRRGDRIAVAGNHWDGYSKGTNMRTSVSGLFPTYKTVETWRFAKTPFSWLNATTLI